MLARLVLGVVIHVLHVNVKGIVGIHITWLVIVIDIDKIAIEITLFSLILYIILQMICLVI